MRSAYCVVALLTFTWLTVFLAATTVTIGDLSSSSTTNYFPVSCYYGYSYTQQIYTQSQINHAGEITKLRFNYSSGTPTNSSNWTIYLGHTSRTNFPGTSSSHWIPVSSMTQVFSGAVSFPGSPGWMEITLTTPFQYDNVNNLVVAVDENTPGYSSYHVNWQGFSSNLNAGIYYYSDSTNPNPASPPTATNTNAFLSELQIVFRITDPPDPAVNPYPANMAVNADARGGIHWQPGVLEPSSYDLYFGTSNPPPFVGNQTSTNYNPGLMDYSTTYYWQVVPRNSYGEASDCPIWSFTTWEDPTISSFPFSEGFNDSQFPPVAWVHTIVNGNYGFMRFTGVGSDPPVNANFEGSARLYYPGTTMNGNANCWLATPEIAMQDPTKHYQVSLAFWKDSTSFITGSLDRIELYLNSSQNLNGNPSLVGTIHRTKSITPAETGADGWYQYRFDLGIGTGQSKYLIIKAVNATWNGYGNGMNIDLLEILEHSAQSAPQQAISPRPGQSAVNLSVRPTLRWENGGGVVQGYRLFMGESPESMQLVSEQAGSTYTFSTNLAWNSLHYWRVDSYNGYGTTEGTVWSFTTETAVVQLSSPANNSTGVALDTILNWQDVANATGYLINVGTSAGVFDIAERVACTESQWSLGSNLLFAASYFWKVVALNGSQEMESPQWTFTTLSGQPQNSSPTNAQTGVDLEAVLQWQPVNGASGYLIDVGSSPGASDIAERVPCSTTQWENPSLWNFSATYYWRIYVLNGTQEISGPEWSFSTIPVVFGTPSPADAATDVSIAAMFNWQDIEHVTAFKIKVGTAPGAGDVIDMADCESSQWIPTANLLYGTSYYWTVYAIRGEQVVASQEWSFSTISGLPQLVSPTDGQSSVALNASLQWQAVPDASGYLIDVGTSEGATDIAERIPCDTNQWAIPGNWHYSTTYYWRVYTLNSSQEISGNQWSFTTLAASFGTPSPANNATNVAINTLLNWPDVAYVSSYKIRVGTSSGASDLVDMEICTSSQWTNSENFLFAQTYYWQVYAIDGEQEIPGPEWQFSTPAGTVTNPSPANNATNTSVFSKTLSWTAIANASGYKVIVGTSPGANDLVEEAIVSTNRYIHPQTWPSSTTIYWMVTTRNGAQEVPGPEWHFTTTAVASLPYLEDFNASTSLPSGWTGNLYISPNHGADGSNGLYDYLINYSTRNVVTNLIGPLTNSVNLEFDYRFMAYNGYPANAYTLLNNQFLRVEVSNNDGASYNLVHRIDNTNHVTSPNFATKVINLNQSGFVSAGDVIRVRFYCISTSGIFYIDIDNVKLVPTLYSPSPVSPIENSTSVALDAAIDWTDVDLASSYLLDVGTSPGATDIANQVPCTDSQWSFWTGWSYNQTYYWRVTALNADSQVTSPEWSFTTVYDPGSTNGYSLSLNGTSQYVNCGNPAAFNNLTAITLEAWIYPTNFLDAPHKNTIIAKDFWGAGANEGFAFRYGSANRTLSFVMSNGSSGWNEIAIPNVLTLNTWQHVAATYNGSAIKLYVNGTQVGSLNRSGVIPPSLRNLLIGQCPASSRFMKGLIDEVRIWNIARSAEEIQSNLYSNLAPHTNLVAYYKMTNGNGALLTDNSGNGHYGTLVSDPLWSHDTPIIHLEPPVLMISSCTVEGTVLLNWEPVAGAAWYGIYRADTPDGDFGIGTRSPDYVSTNPSITISIGSQSIGFFKVVAGLGTP